MAMAPTAVAATAVRLIKGGKGGGGSAQMLLPTPIFTFSCYRSQVIFHKKKPIGPVLLSLSARLLHSNHHNPHHLIHSISTNAGVDADAISTSSSEQESQSAENASADNSSPSGKIKDTGNLLDIRVGRIIKAWRHEEADSLYVEQVDVGEAEPRIICSGLVKYTPIHHLQDRNVVVLANLKPRNMRGVKSSGMLMAASDAAHENVELLQPPDGSIPGDRVWFGSPDDQSNLPDPASPNQIQKKKIWELVQPHLKTDDSGIAMLGGEHFMRASAGLVVSKSLMNASVS